MEAIEGFEHYKAVDVLSDYAGVAQRWVLFCNQQSRASEQKTLTRRMQKKSLRDCEKLDKLSKKPLGVALLIRQAKPEKTGFLVGGIKEKEAILW